MENLNNLIDATTFGTVRRYLRAAHSPITTVMLVQHRDTLPQVGTALVAQEGGCRAFRRRQWAEWFTSGEVRVVGACNGPGQSAESIGKHLIRLCLAGILILPPVITFGKILLYASGAVRRPKRGDCHRLFMHRPFSTAQNA